MTATEKRSAAARFTNAGQNTETVEALASIINELRAAGREASPAAVVATGARSRATVYRQYYAALALAEYLSHTVASKEEITPSVDPGRSVSTFEPVVVTCIPADATENMCGTPACPLVVNRDPAERISTSPPDAENRSATHNTKRQQYSCPAENVRLYNELTSVAGGGEPEASRLYPRDSDRPEFVVMSIEDVRRELASLFRPARAPVPTKSQTVESRTVKSHAVMTNIDGVAISGFGSDTVEATSASSYPRDPDRPEFVVMSIEDARRELAAVMTLASSATKIV